MTADQHRARLRRLGNGRRAFKEEAPDAAREAREALTATEIAELLGITRPALYELMRRGQ